MVAGPPRRRPFDDAAAADHKEDDSSSSSSSSVEEEKEKEEENLKKKSLLAALDAKWAAENSQESKYNPDQAKLIEISGYSVNKSICILICEVFIHCSK